MANRNEVYVINSSTGARYAVPRKHFDDTLKAQGYVIDPDGPSAAAVDTRTVKASKKAIATAQAGNEAENEAGAE